MRINVQPNSIYVMNTYGGYLIKKFSKNGIYMGDVETDNGKLFDWINLSTKKYGHFTFREFKIWDAIIDSNGNEVFAVKKNENVFLIIRNDLLDGIIDTLYSCDQELYGLYFDENDNLYFVQNSGKIILLKKNREILNIINESSTLYSGITEILFVDNLGLVTANNTDNFIRVYDNNYSLKFKFGGEKYFDRESEDGGGGLAGFDVDDDLNIYTVDWVVNRISIFSPIYNGNIITGYQFNKILIQ